MVPPLRFRDFTTHTSIKGGGISKHNMYIQYKGKNVCGILNECI